MKEIAPSPNVDMIWHAHIQMGEPYEDMCDELFDGRFIDHEPATTTEEMQESRVLLQKTKRKINNVDKWVWGNK